MRQVKAIKAAAAVSGFFSLNAGILDVHVLLYVGMCEFGFSLVSICPQLSRNYPPPKNFHPCQAEMQKLIRFFPPAFPGAFLDTSALTLQGIHIHTL